MCTCIKAHRKYIDLLQDKVFGTLENCTVFERERERKVKLHFYNRARRLTNFFVRDKIFRDICLQIVISRVISVSQLDCLICEELCNNCAFSFRNPSSDLSD